MEKPSASVVVVIDYKAGGEDAFSDLRRTLGALAAQDWREQVEFLLVEPEGAAALPDDLGRDLPGLRIVHVPARTSYDLKNAGAREASADLVVILDADCVPAPGWLGSVVRHHRAHPRAAAISGRTVYRAEGLLPRVFALVDRSYVDAGGPGRARAISNNNAAFRRDAMLRYPLRNDLGTFGSKMQSEAMLAAGEELRFEPGMVAAHAYDGWRMQRIARRHMGFAMARFRQLDPGARHGWMFRLGLAGVPLIWAMAVAGSWKAILKRHAAYGVGALELPAALAIALAIHAFEVPGVVHALRDGQMAFGDGYV